jgi:hypothetical protein
MPKNPTKVKDSTGPCFSCGDTIFCNEKEYNGTVSLQWQGKDGKAHYTKTGECKDSIPTNTPNIQSMAQPEKKVEWVDAGEHTKEEDVIVGGLERFRSLAYQDVKKLHPTLSVNSDKFGTIVNASITHMIGLAKVKAIKDSE